MEKRTLKEIRIALKMTPSDFAGILNISENAYLLKENGETRFKAYEIIELSRKLRIRPDSIEITDHH